METVAVTAREATVAPLNARRLVLLICVGEAVWLAGIGYALSLIS